jgi:hypothetical protein
MISTAPLSLDRADQQVEGMIQQGTTFARVEDAIDDAHFSRDHKAALWLLAWSLRDAAVQLSDARLMAASFARTAWFGPDQAATEGVGCAAETSTESPPPTGSTARRACCRRPGLET